VFSTKLTLAEWSQPRRWTLALAWPAWLVPLAAALLALLLILAEARELTQHPAVSLRVDTREAGLLLNGFHAIERDGRGVYRWSSGDSRIDFDPVAAGGPLALTLRLGPPPPQLAAAGFALRFGARPYATLPSDARPRQYHLLVPPDAPRLDGLTITLQSETISSLADQRPVGLRFESATVAIVGARTVWPAPGLALAQTALLLLGALLLGRLEVPPAAGVIGLALLALAILVLRSGQDLLIYRYLTRLAVALALLTGLTYWLLPCAERRLDWLGPPRLVRALWGVTILACLIRLAGALYPLFSGFDLGLNVDRLIQNLTGQLVITRRSIEFHNGITIYPPGPYLAFMPGLLLGLAPPLLVQSAIALVDGLGALAVGALARALGARPRAALLAALLYAAVPVGLTALWWGLTAQVFGQALMAPLTLALLAALRAPRRVARWAVAGALLAVAALSHIGVTIVAFAWLGLVWLALARRRAAPPDAWRRLTLALAISGVIGVALLYIDAAALKVRQFDTIGREILAEGYEPIYALIWRGFLIAFHPLVLLLLPAGLLLLLRRRLPVGGAELALSWIGTALIFLLVEIATGLQVRYIYFLTPLACILAGLLLDRLATHGAAARRVTWTIALLLLVQGSTAWLTSAFEDLRMSMVSLLR
jgi:toxin CptA